VIEKSCAKFVKVISNHAIEAGSAAARRAESSSASFKETTRKLL
jgi:hypothetical protein